MSTPSLEEVVYKGKTLAYVWRKKLRVEGVKFLTPVDFPLQLGLMEHPKGKVIRTHRHRDLRYKVNTTQEFLYIERGKVAASIYNNDWKLVKKFVLGPGDFMLSVAGGHGFRVLTASRIIEIKQGPYPGDAKAKIFMDEEKNI